MLKLLALIPLLILVGCSKAPQVVVDGELLVGTYEGTVAAFRGVPFAEPPLGDLRWRAPQPLVTKVDRRDASRFAAACMQTMRILDWYRYMAETFGASRDYYDDLEVSEDCLYLNVWTRSVNSNARMPVMVWVHGGSNNPQTIIGASLLIQAPTGEYESDKLINVGTNRWAAKPAIGMMWPIRPTWLLEVEVGAWIFGDNTDFLGETR